MGKAKRRSIAKGKYNQLTNLAREDAVAIAVDKINKKENPEEIITLFGLTAEELLEAGADYEAVKSLGRLF